MTNSPSQQAEIVIRLRRLTGLTSDQIAALSQSLDYASVESWSDGVLAAAASGMLPTLALNPSGGLPLGLPGAVQPTRFAGGTTSGAPTTGSYAVGDFVVAADGHLWICTTAGSPGSWTDPAASGSSAAGAAAALALVFGGI